MFQNFLVIFSLHFHHSFFVHRTFHVVRSDLLFVHARTNLRHWSELLCALQTPENRQVSIAGLRLIIFNSTKK